MLLRLIIRFNLYIKYKVIIKTIFYFIFVVFLKIDEFIYSIKNLENEKFNKYFFTRRSIRLYENYLELILSILKIDFFRRDIIFIVFDINDNIYIVRVLRYLF